MGVAVASDPETLEAQLGELRRIRAGGVRSTSLQGEQVEFRSDSELAAAIADLEQQISQFRNPGPVRVTYITSTKGVA